MPNLDLADDSVWRLHARGRELARLTVTGTDFPWVHATIEEMPGFEEFRPLFERQERACDVEDWEALDQANAGLNNAITLTTPDGSAVAEFLLRVHGDGTAGWRCRTSRSSPTDAVAAWSARRASSGGRLALGAHRPQHRDPSSPTGH